MAYFFLSVESFVFPSAVYEGFFLFFKISPSLGPFDFLLVSGIITYSSFILAVMFLISPSLCSFPIAYKHAEVYPVTDLPPTTFLCISLLHVIHSFFSPSAHLSHQKLSTFIFSVLSSSISFVCPLFYCVKKTHI